MTTTSDHEHDWRPLGNLEVCAVLGCSAHRAITALADQTLAELGDESRHPLKESTPQPSTLQPSPPAHLVGKANLKLVAYVLWCGDDDCDCTEPVIAWQYTEETASGITVYKREAIWTGTFVSRGDGGEPEDPNPNDELRAACERLGVSLPNLFRDADT